MREKRKIIFIGMTLLTSTYGLSASNDDLCLKSINSNARTIDGKTLRQVINCIQRKQDLKKNNIERGERGDKGDKGDKGDQGDKGDKGDKGDQGEQGNQGVAGETGMTGSKGARGYRGFKGIAGEKGEQGVQGQQGIKGDPGERGPMGPAGNNKIFIRDYVLTTKDWLGACADQKIQEGCFINCEDNKFCKKLISKSHIDYYMGIDISHSAKARGCYIQKIIPKKDAVSMLHFVNPYAGSVKCAAFFKQGEPVYTNFLSKNNHITFTREIIEIRSEQTDYYLNLGNSHILDSTALYFVCFGHEDNSKFNQPIQQFAIHG